MDKIVPVSDPSAYKNYVGSQTTATGEQSTIENDYTILICHISNQY